MADPKPTLEVHNGMVVIRSPYLLSDKPMMWVNYYPTGIRACNIAEDLIGKPLRMAHDWGFVYLIRENGITRFEHRLAGDTNAIHQEEIAIPCPKVRAGIETRWCRDRWEKYLKTKGWVIA